MRCFIVGQDPSEVARLARLSAELGCPGGVRQGLDALRLELDRPGAGRALVLLAGAGLMQGATRLAAEHGDKAFVVVIADSIPSDDYKSLVRTGAGEWVQWSSCETELADLVTRLAAPAQAGAHGGDGARIITFVPSKGGVGNTSLLAEVGVLLAGPRGGAKRALPAVALLDLNVQGGTLADLLDVEPRFDLAEVAGRPERLDEQLAEVFASRYAETLDVYAPPHRAMVPDGIASNLIFTFIDTISPKYAIILVDLPPMALGWTETLIEGSDAVVVTGIATVPGLRCLRTRLTRLDEMRGPGRRRLAVVNQAATDMMGRFTRRAEITRLLGGGDHALVRRDCGSMDTAADTGQPLVEVAPDGRLGRDIRAIAKWIEAAARPAESAKEAIA